MSGRAPPGAMVCNPKPGILKLMVSAPGLLLASLIAPRKVQMPPQKLESLVELTVKVVAYAGAAIVRNAANTKITGATLQSRRAFTVDLPVRLTPF
jgi:hypothetical protein